MIASLPHSPPIAGDGEGERILVAQTSFLGDAVLTLPLLREIRRAFPRARLALLCRAGVTELFSGAALVDEVIADDKRGADRGLAALWRLARELRRRGFTLAVSPHRSLRTALLLWLAAIPRRVGFCESAGWFFYHHRARRPRQRHDVERNLSLLAALGIRPETVPTELELPVPPNARQRAKEVLRSCGFARVGDAKVFGLNPGSVWPTKRWSAGRYAELMRLLKRRYRCQILLFGGGQDAETVAEVERLAPGLGINLAGRLALDELPGAIEQCDVFVTNDSGPMHIAVARGVPVVAIFCATTPGLGFYPYSSRAIVVEKALPCRPCSPHGGLRCPLGTEDCIRLVRAEHVIEAIERLLQGAAHPAGGEERFRPRLMTL